VISEADALVKTAARAAVTAGRDLVRPFRTGVAARAKPGTHGHDVVTAADAAAEAMIGRELTAAFPGSVVVGEESGGADDEGDVRWYVDPIDGTHNFARGVPLFCVSIGVTVRGAPAGGCVYDPVHDELFTAAGGRFRLNGLPVPARPPGARAMLLADVPRPGVVPDPAELALFADLLAAADVRRIGSSALALAYVACGRADAAVTADAFVWDVAAGRTLVTAAGGVFAAVPGEPSAVRPGGFAAWRPGSEELGAAALAGLRGLPVG
jgi:myo-inositol-1(or 4)-monophosphatase